MKFKMLLIGDGMFGLDQQYQIKPISLHTTGSKKEHSISGCTCCNTVSGCAPNGTPCSCTKHVAQRLLSSPHMQCCVKFVNQNNVAVIPVKEIVVEFSNNR